MANILIARSQQKTQHLLPRLINVSDNVIFEPLFSIHRVDFSQKWQHIYQQQPPKAIIVSSKNAVYALRTLNIPKTTIVFAVGKNTAKDIADLGYKNIVFPQINGIENLLYLIKQYHFCHSDYFLYLRGEKIKTSLPLPNLKELIVYKTNYNKQFSIALLNFLAHNQLDKVYIFSAHSLAIFFHKMQNNNLQNKIISANICCISDEVASLAKIYGYKQISTFAEIV
jgi:uroporphyrinogen-III synthase